MSVDPLGARVVAVLTAARSTVATAESLTGGLVGAALTSVPGSSLVVRGGVIAYATDLKATLLGVDPGLLAARGPVDADVALAMASGVAGSCGAAYGVATTGEAGPEPSGSAAVGTVFVAVHGPAGGRVSPLLLPGGRDEVRTGTVAAALELLLQVLEQR